DENAEKLLKLLKAQGVSCRTLLRVRDRSTPRKVRIVAQQHQLLRLDFERAEPISPATEAALERRTTPAIGKPGSRSRQLDAVAPARVAAELANLAAGRVVLKFGTATLSTPDLLKAIQDSTMGGGFLEASPRRAR